MPTFFEKIFKPEKTQTKKSLEKITPEQEEKDLLEKKVIKSTPLKPGEHLNRVDFVELENGQKAIFKPTRNFKEERAAYLVSRALEFDLVPITVIREIEEETESTIGSFQKFIPEAKTGRELGSAKASEIRKEKKELEDQFLKFYIFVYLIDKGDYENSGNYLIDKNRKLWMIDNEFAFRSFSHQTVDVRYELLLKPIPQEIKEKIKKFASDQEKIELLKEQLKELIDEEQIEYFLKRLEKLTKLFEQSTLPSEREDWEI